MSRPKQRESDPAQHEWDLDILGIAHAKISLEIGEVATALRMGEQSVRNLIDEGKFVKCPKGAGEVREHITVERWSVVAWKLNLMEAQGFPVAQLQLERIQNFALVNVWRQTLKASQKSKSTSAATKS